MMRILNWLAGIVAAIIAGLAVFFLTQEEKRIPPPGSTVSHQITVQFDRIGGPFSIIGSGETRVWASAPLAENKANWHRLSVSVTNDCRSGRIHLDASDFSLHLATSRAFPGGRGLSPTLQALEHQPELFPASWIAPGETVNGELIFRVWENEFESDPNRMWHFIRIRADAPCPVRYLPQ